MPEGCDRAVGAGQHVQPMDAEVDARDLAVEGLDHPIAVTICLRDRVVGAVAASVGISGQVEPMPAHALAICLGCQQAIDDLLISVRGGVADEGVDLFR